MNLLKKIYRVIDTPDERSRLLVDVFKDWVLPNDTILEIGSGDNRNINKLKENGFLNIDGIDKKNGTAIEDVPEKQYDIIYTMSTLFLIPRENEWVFEKIARMAKKYLFLFEGKYDANNGYKQTLWGRNYKNIFEQFGYTQVYEQDNLFNETGILRILKK